MAEQSDLGNAMQWLQSHIDFERLGAKAQQKSHEEFEVRMQYMANLLDLMDNPQKSFQSIHITGTNGKTSVSWLATRLMLANGLRTGTYTSPHLQRFNERIAVAATEISDRELAEVLHAISLLEQVIAENELPSYFEIMAAAAFRHFADAPVDVAVVEVGLGGQWDATNVLGADVAVITNIGLDHQNVLGHTRAEIAETKAGIIKPGATLVTGETDPEMLEIFARRQPGSMWVLGRDFDVVSNKMAVGGRLLSITTPEARYVDVFVPVHGQHQGVNVAVAVASAEAFFQRPLSPEVVNEAMATVSTPGRMEVASRQPLVILDGAHNGDAARQLSQSLDEEFSSEVGRILVVGALEGHDPVEILRALSAERARLVVATSVECPRAISATTIADAAQTLGAPTVVVEDPVRALEEAKAAAGESDVVVVTGSLYLVGQLRGVSA